MLVDRSATDRPGDHSGDSPAGRSESRSTADRLVAAGRATLASLFVLGGIAKIASPGLYLAMMNEAGIAPARPLLTLVIALELGGGLWVAAGLRGHGAAAAALALHTLLVNALVHPFWHVDGSERIDEISFFFKNVSIAGGLLLVAALAWSRR